MAAAGKNDYYKTLGVKRTASADEVRKAYRRLARKYHPDVNPGDQSAETRFKGINEAYEVLGDSDKRNKYDELGANWRQYDQAQAASGSPGGNVRIGGPMRTGKSAEFSSPACGSPRSTPV